MDLIVCTQQYIVRLQLEESSTHYFKNDSKFLIKRHKIAQKTTECNANIFYQPTIKQFILLNSNMHI